MTAGMPVTQPTIPWHRRYVCFFQDIYRGSDAHVSQSTENGPLFYLSHLVEASNQVEELLPRQDLKDHLTRKRAILNATLTHLENGTPFHIRLLHLAPTLLWTVGTLFLSVYLPDVAQFIRFCGQTMPLNFLLGGVLLCNEKATVPMIWKSQIDRFGVTFVPLLMYLVTLHPHLRHLDQSEAYRYAVNALSVLFVFPISFPHRLAALRQSLTKWIRPAQKLEGNERSIIRKHRDAWNALNDFLTKYIENSDISNNWKDYFLDLKTTIAGVAEIYSEALPEEDNIKRADNHRLNKLAFVIAGLPVGATFIYFLRNSPWAQSNFIVWTGWYTLLFLDSTFTHGLIVDDVQRRFSNIVGPGSVPLPMVIQLNFTPVGFGNISFIVGWCVYHFIAGVVFRNVLALGVNWLCWAIGRIHKRIHYIYKVTNI
ncbi:hypothetical protein HFN63_33125 [Rhizobium leguminosarum]|uniref:hypothetical protein n=1 Tax=Rhizobium leguminosarum TaxID=384 RepID=UPI001C986EA6|nr:hypothetical protein [Rhizobium leguminosarum]MBY5774871.1 hypothetical protein [Rhizobium leguminosarum]